MDVILSALTATAVTVFNGVVAAGAVLLNPVTVSVVVLAGSLAWLAAIELEELTRQGTKPDIQLH
jgi:hypothetical protein